MHILVVDGTAERLSAILKILIDGGYGRVETLTNPYALIERIAKSRPELIIAGGDAKGIDCLAQFAQLKTSTPDYDATSIAVVDVQESESFDPHLQAGADDYIVRPFTAAALLYRVELQSKSIATKREIRTLRSIVDQRTGRMNAALNLLRSLEKYLVAAGLSTNRNAPPVPAAADAAAGADTTSAADTTVATDVKDFKDVTNGTDSSDSTEGDDTSLKMHIAEVNVGGVITETSEMFGALAKKGDIALDVRIEPDLPIIETDQEKLRQVMVDLISNSIKSTPAKGRVLLSAKRNEEKGVLVLLGRDVGIGLTADDLHSFMGRQQDGQQNSGPGVGLPITRKLVEMMGGTIEVRTMKGRGASVKIELPMSIPGMAATAQHAA
ncbi:MAG: ATP-binding protein [Alphaproteobacteria bacterium]|nr:ATP-binding protein [Alphaproteobacteria bacterium]